MTEQQLPERLKLIEFTPNYKVKNISSDRAASDFSSRCCITLATTSVVSTPFKREIEVICPGIDMLMIQFVHWDGTSWVCNYSN